MPEYSFKCVLVGGNTLLIQCAEHLLKKGHEITAVVSSEASTKEWARENGVVLISPTDDLYGQLRKSPFDYLFSIVNFDIIPDEVLALPSMFSINFHDGPLPQYAGLNVTSWAILNNEKNHGICWHLMTSEIDRGDILKSVSFPVSDSETALTLNSKCYEAAISSFQELTSELESGLIKPEKQEKAPVHYYLKHEAPSTGLTISWNKPAEEISTLVRALSFGPYNNPIGLPKLLIGKAAVNIGEVEVHDNKSVARPGTITSLGDDHVKIATQTTDISIRGVSALNGAPLTISEFNKQFSLKPNLRLTDPDTETTTLLTRINKRVAKHEDYWLKQLLNFEPVEAPFANNSVLGTAQHYLSVPMRLPLEAINKFIERNIEATELLVAVFSAYVSRIVNKDSFHIGLRHSGLYNLVSDAETIYATHVPMHFTIDLNKSFEEHLDQATTSFRQAMAHLTYANDITARYPELTRLRDSSSTSFPITVSVFDNKNEINHTDTHKLTLAITRDTLNCQWFYDPRVYDENSIVRMQEQYCAFLSGIVHAPSSPMGEIPLLTNDERAKVLHDWNATTIDYQRDACIHQLFEKQAERTPDSTAIVFRNTSLTYNELNTKANQLAHYLTKQGVGRESIVGLCIERSVDMLIGAIAIHKAGGAYLPLDPSYPADRLTYMLEDSGASVVLTQKHLLETVHKPDICAIAVDTLRDEIDKESTENLAATSTADNLAYVIYTSGSTGKPKGVMVEHHNVANFFKGMDKKISYDPPGVWLAVTSLSFDISVLELFWTLSHGFKVILYSDESRRNFHAPQGTRHPDKPIDFSLFYWNLANDEDHEIQQDKYRLLMESAKFADENGFSAVWTPERHFHAFGGLYPNPSVVSAALAVTTQNIRIRAGSCVLPLHHPIRVAEEWAVVDNLSNGRVDLGIAAGWMPNDFVLRPENHANNKQVMIDSIEVLRKLWSGETVNFPGPKGDVEVQTLPRPIQPTLPICITAAGNPETFEMAARLGANILTHLLGQSVEQVGEKLALYRKVWRECGHPGEGHITLMLHTLVTDDDDYSRQTARLPMKSYLKSAAGLVKQAAWHFPTFKEKSAEEGQTLDDFFDSASEEDMDALLNFAVERYYNTSGLFGTPERCISLVDQLKEIGVDEVGCLIDFGISTNTVLEKLPYLNELRKLANAQEISETYNNADYTIAGLIKRHDVSHMQCTPSMAKMLVSDALSQEAIKDLSHIMVGGEALSEALATEILSHTEAKLTNMYGPTETTIWSATYDVDKTEGNIPIGKPIANTELYILDKHMQPTPIGIPGELMIGGDGVVRGYLKRPQLTAERFISHPFSKETERRLYRTGDLARYLPDGNIEFLGRLDHQVKIRGYRVELGEIESLLHRHPDIHDTVVTLYEDENGNKSLVAYLVAKDSSGIISATKIRDYLKNHLADFMLPAAYISLPEMPLTPNGKIDRNALPKPTNNILVREKSYVAPRSKTESILAESWGKLLHTNQIGVNESFFDIGGDSLLAVQMAVSISEQFGVSLPLQSVFESPRIAELAKRIDSAMEASSSA